MAKQNDQSAFVVIPKTSNQRSMSRSSRPFTEQTNRMVKEPNMLKAVKEGWNQTSPELRSKIIQTGAELAKKHVKFPEMGTSPNIVHSSGYALSKAPTPKEIRLDSGITPNTYTSDYLDAKENNCSPLHLTAAILYFPDYAASRLYDYFNKIISFDLQSKVQDNVGFNLKIDTEFTPTKILVAFNALASALQTYFYYASILAYHDEPSNNNEGMIYLRTQITPQMMEDLYRLQRRLANTPCPPALLELIRYLNGNYVSGPNQGAPMVKIFPSASPVTVFMVNGSDISSALTNLSTSDTNQVFSLMRRAVPHWKIGTLFDVEVIPLYDANFMTIFANLPFRYFTGTTVLSPVVSTDDTSIPYNSFTNVLDGVAYSLTSIYNSTSSAWAPGLMVPSPGTGSVGGSTRKSYYEVSGVKGFYNAGSYPFLCRSRPETTTINDLNNGVISVHMPGCDRCLSVNINTLTETSMKVFDYLMSWDSIRKERQSGFNTPAKDNTSKRRK